MAKQAHEDYLLNSLISGNKKGILEIYRRVFPKVQKYILKNHGFEAEAKDIFQVALIQLALRAKAPDFAINTTFEGYLFTICKNLWRREKKLSQKDRVTKREIQAQYIEKQEIVSFSLEQEKWELFQEKLNAISENCQLLLRLYFNKESHSKIAKQLGYANENVVRQRIFKCKKMLKDAIQSDSRYHEITDQ